jgi:hypothetical protein
MPLTRVKNSTTEYNVGATGQVSRGFEDKMSDVVSIKDFGAVGDGVTDDTAALQAALDSCNNNGRNLLLNEGTYLVSSVLTVDSTARGVMSGVGVNSSVIKSSITDPNVSVITSNARNFSFKQFSIDCAATGTTGQDTNPVGLEIADRHDSYAFVRDVRVINCRNFGFIFNEFYDTKYENLTAFDCGWTFQHKNIFKLHTVNVTQGSTTVTSPDSIFDAGDVGKEIYFGAATGGSAGGGFITTIASFTSATSVEITTAAPFTYSSNRVFFGPVTVTGTSGSPTLTMSDAGEFDLTGRRIVVPTKTRAQMYTVSTHSGTTLTLTTNLSGDTYTGGSPIITGGGAHFIDGNGGEIHLDCEASLGPVITGRLDWVKAWTKAQVQTPHSAFHVWGGFHTIVTNGTGVAMPMYTMSGDSVNAFHVDNLFNVHTESDRTGITACVVGTQYAKVELKIPRNVKQGWDSIDNTFGDSRNLILNFQGTSNGFSDSPEFYSRPTNQFVVSSQLTDDFTEVTNIANLSPDFLYDSTTIDGVAGVKVYGISVVLQDLDFTSADVSNHYKVVLSSDPRGIVSTTEFEMWQGSGDFTETSSAAFYTLTASPNVSSRTKSDKMFVSLRKVGTPPALNGGLANASITLVAWLDY